MITLQVGYMVKQVKKSIWNVGRYRILDFLSIIIANGIIFHSQWVEAKENSKKKNKTPMTAQQARLETFLTIVTLGINV